jgi:hypothetical protein
MDLTTNGFVITDSIKFVQTTKEKLTSNKKGDKESKEPDYDDDKDQLEKSRKRNLENKIQLIKFSEKTNVDRFVLLHII